MEPTWDNRSGRDEDSDNTENQPQDQNNNGNIGREEAAGKDAEDQNPAERGQFGTTAEKGSGAIEEQPQAYSDNDGLAREREKGQEGYNETENSGVYGQSQREVDRNWAQGSEGSPGQGYQDDHTSGNRHQDSSDEGGLTDKYEGQPGNFADRNADQQIQPPENLANKPEDPNRRYGYDANNDDDDISDEERTKDELI